MGDIATKILSRPIDRDLYVVDPARLPLTRGANGARHPYGQTAGDRLRIGYGRLTIYLGSVAGSGKTYAMLDRAHQLIEEGVDVTAAPDRNARSNRYRSEDGRYRDAAAAAQW